MVIKEQKTIKFKRRFYLLCLVLLIVILGLYNFFKVKNYTVFYYVDEVKVEESYNKNQKSYLYKFNYDNQDFVWAFKKDYNWQKRMVKQINVLQNEEETCLLIQSNQLKFYPLCQKNGEQISYLLASDRMKQNFNVEKIAFNEEENKVNDITVYNYFYHHFYIWNYRGFDYLSEDKEKKIELFDEDIYDPKLIVQTDNYILIPDYSSDYYFSKVFLINDTNEKVITWDLKKQIYFDSKILGIIDDEIYLLDNHENIEWKVNLKKRKVEKIGTKNKDGLFLENDWLKLSLNKIAQKNQFEGLNAINFISENGLKAKINDKTIILKNEDVKIIGFKNDKVYYLIKDILYEYNLNFGEIKLLSKFEWNFNNQNMIYIF